MANFLEQLVSEWLEFQGYFVRRNVRIGKRAKGGFSGEIDVVAFHPGRNHLVHYETSTDADAWHEREARFKKKFETAKPHIAQIFAGLPIPSDPEQIALLAYATGKKRSQLGGGRLVTLSELFNSIRTELSKSVTSNAVPEGFPILRSLQFAMYYWKVT